VVKVPKANNLVMYQENKLDVGRYTNTNENREIARLTVLCYYSVPRQVEEGIQTNGGSGASLDHSSVSHRSPAPYPTLVP